MDDNVVGVRFIGVKLPRYWSDRVQVYSQTLLPIRSNCEPIWCVK